MRKYIEAETKKAKRAIELCVERPEVETALEGVFVTSPDEKNAFVSLVGAHAAGKTTLNSICYAKWLQEILKEEEIQVHYVYYSLLDVTAATTSIEIWQAIGKRIYGKLKRAYTMDNEENKYRREQLQEAIDKLMTVTERKSGGDALRELLELWREMGVYVILVLDEVNALGVLPEEERRAVFKELYGIAKDKTNYSISILLLSQRRMVDLIGETDEMKDFSSYYKETVLNGFTLSEMARLCKERGIRDAKKVKEILRYCGTHPGLLGIMCEIAGNDEGLTSEDCYNKGKESIEEIYKWYEDRLREVEFLALEGFEDETINGLGVYKQVFEKDADFDSEFELEEWLDVLSKKGLVGTVKEDRESYALRGSFVRDKGYNYVPLAPCFMEYLRRNEDKQAAEEMRSLRTKLRSLEKQIRKLIYDAYYEIMKENNLFSADPDTLPEEKRWDEFNDRMKLAVTRHATTNNADSLNRDKIVMWEGRNGRSGIKKKVRNARRYGLTVIDVLSFVNYAELIEWEEFKEKGWSTSDGRLCWDKVKSRLRCYEISDEQGGLVLDVATMKSEFKDLKDARNAFAHGSEEIHFMEASERVKVITLCDKILNCIKEEA